MEALGDSHAVLGVGGVGATIAALLARSGLDVQLIMREESVWKYEGALSIEGSVEATVRIPATSKLSQTVDVLWVATKAYQLKQALERVQDATIEAAVIPLLNGVDHVAQLRANFGAESVVPGAIRMHAAKVDVHRVRFHGWHVTRANPPLMLAPMPQRQQFTSALRESLSNAIPIGIADEPELLWGKLADLASLGSVSSLTRSMSAVREEPHLWDLSCAAVREIVGVAAVMGATLDEDAIISRHARVTPGSTSSLYRDLIAGGRSELCAILDPPIREGIAAGLPVVNLLRIRQLLLDRYAIGRPFINTHDI